MEAMGVKFYAISAIGLSRNLSSAKYTDCETSRDPHVESQGCRQSCSLVIPEPLASMKPWGAVREFVAGIEPRKATSPEVSAPGAI